MRTDFRKGRELTGKLFGHDPRLQRPQTNPHDPVHFVNLPDQLHQMSLPVKIDPVGAQVDSRKDNLPVSVLRQVRHLSDDLLHCPAPHASSCVRDDTISTELVAAVLDFDIRPRVISRPGQMKRLILLRPPDLFHLSYTRMLPASFGALTLIFLENPDKILFVIISEHNIDARIHFFSILRLDITSGSHNHRIRVHLPGAMKHLAGFPVRNIGHGTGVDHIDIRSLPKGNDLISCLLKHLLHGLCFIRVYLASQIVKRCFFHVNLPLFSSIVS